MCATEWIKLPDLGSYCQVISKLLHVIVQHFTDIKRKKVNSKKLR